MKHPQEVATNIGKYACLALSYIELASVKLNITISSLAELVSHYESLINKGIMTQECYILNADKFLEAIFNHKFEVTKSLQNPGEWCIATNGQHFVIVNDVDKIVWNSLNNNEAWKKLPIKSYRVLKLIK